METSMLISSVSLKHSILLMIIVGLYLSLKIGKSTEFELGTTEFS